MGRNSASVDQTASGGASLAWLLHPVDTGIFLREYWDQRPLFIDRGNSRYHDSLPGLAEVDGLLSTGVYSADRLDGRLMQTGPDGAVSRRAFSITAEGRLDLHDVYEAYDSGYTVILNRIESRSAVLGALCRRLEEDLNHRVGANLYLTPAGTQGANPHIDSHDVLLVQIHGSKTWRVSAESIKRNRAGADPGQRIELGEHDEWTLVEGDALYIPHGFVHAGVTHDTSSLHITFGFNVLTWADLLTETLDRIASSSEELQRPLPLGHLGKPIDENTVTMLQNQLISALTKEELRAAQLSLGSKLLARHTSSTGHFPSLDAVAALDLETRVGRGFEGPHRFRVAEERLTCEFPGNFVTVPASLAPALRYALSRPTFRVGELPGGLSERQRIDFIARLIRDGLLAVFESERG